MEIISLNIAKIKKESPKSWGDFIDYTIELDRHSNFSSNQSFEEYPFEYQLGVIFRYFSEQGVIIDVTNLDYSDLPKAIEEEFLNFNQVVSHFS